MRIKNFLYGCCLVSTKNKGVLTDLNEGNQTGRQKKTRLHKHKCSYRLKHSVWLNKSKKRNLEMLLYHY